MSSSYQNFLLRARANKRPAARCAPLCAPGEQAVYPRGSSPGFGWPGRRELDLVDELHDRPLPVAIARDGGHRLDDVLVLQGIVARELDLELRFAASVAEDQTLDFASQLADSRQLAITQR